MNALAVIVVMLGGALLWGMAGLILFLPALAIFRVIGEDIPPLKPWADLIGDKAKTE
jgi:predicted PurR-regulated permease PerM